MQKSFEFGELILTRIQVCRLTPAELAKTFRVTDATIRNWISGKSSPARRLNELAEVLFPNTGRWNPEKVAFMNRHNRAFGQPEITPPPEPPETSTGGNFVFAGRELSMMVMDFCAAGYSHERFEATLVPWTEPELPEEWKAREALAMADAKAQETAGAINDNQIVALRIVAPTRDGPGERQGFRMSFSDMNYVKKRAGIILYNKYLTDAERSPLLDAVREWKLHPALSRCLNTQVAVITSDGKFMFARRSNAIINGGKVACGIAETMEGTDRTRSDGREEPDVFRAALRGLVQEAGINFDAANAQPQTFLKFLSLSFDTEYYEPQFIGVADFRKAEGSLHERTQAFRIKEGLQNGDAKDRWENKELIFVDFDPRSIFGFAAKNELTDYGLLCAIQTLRYEGFDLSDLTYEYLSAIDR